MAQATWLEHTADLLLQVEAADRPELFALCAAKMYEAIGLAPCRPREKKSFSVQGENTETCLVLFLNELLFSLTRDRFAAAAFDRFQFSPAGLQVQVRGETLPRQNQRGLREIKAATYHELSFRETAQGCRATVLFDI